MRRAPYRTVLGAAWGQLPAALQAMHAPFGAVAEGRAAVVRGRSLAARAAGGLLGFPPAGEDVPLSLRFEPWRDGELWTRRFAGRRMASRQWAGRRGERGLLCEAMGPLVFACELVLADGRLSLVLRRWRLLFLPLPLGLAPRVEAAESAEDGRFHFDVAVAHPLTGPIVRYSGWLGAPTPLAPPPAFDALMVFDGVCNLCSGYVRLMLAIDRRATIRFAAVQSPLGRRLCREQGVDPDDPSTFLFFDRGRALEATDAMAAMLRRLEPPWRWLALLTVVPRPMRNGLYRWMARNRYRLLGKRPTCMVPTPETRARFLDEAA